MKLPTCLVALVLAAACAPDPAAEYNITTTVKPPTPGNGDGTGGSELTSDAGPATDDAAPSELPDAAEELAPEADALDVATGSPTGGVTVSIGFGGPDAADGPIDASARPVDARAARDLAGLDGGIVVAKQCSEVYCPALFEVAGKCSGHESGCRSQTGNAPAGFTVTRYCHANGVKKVATSGPAGSAFRTVLEVRAPGDRDCYQLEMTTPANSAVEHWVFRQWSGDIIARGSWNSTTGKTYLTCEGVTYDVSATDCPGTDGEPVDDECPRGTCN